MAYSSTGEGMHRFVDPADGETYLYAQFFMDDGQRIFAAFDQPDLKAAVRRSRSPRRRDWTVARQRRAGRRPRRTGRWEFAPTAPLATYFFVADAGP